MKPVGDNLIMVARNRRYSDRDFRLLFLWAVDDCNQPPPKGLELVAEFIETDQSALLRRIAEKVEERKEKKREYAKKRYEEQKREKRDSVNSTHSTNSTDTIPTNQPTTPTSLPTETNVSVLRPNGRDNTRAPAKAAPKIEAVLAWAADGVHKPDGRPIPETFVREWCALMEASVPPWTNTRGRSLVKTWRQDLIYAWQREVRFNRRGNGGGSANQPDGVVHHEEGYENPL